MKPTGKKTCGFARLLLRAIPLVAACHATAAPILVDFGHSSQTTALAGWNNMSADTGNDPANLTNLADSTGTPTAIDLAYSTNGNDSGAAGPGANYNGPYPASLSAYPQSALQDGLFFAANNITLTLSDLDTASTYDLTLFGARGNNGTGASFTITGAAVSNGSFTTVHNNATEVVTLSDIAPDANGRITILMETTGSGSSSLNFLSLEAGDTTPPNPNLDPAKPNVLIIYFDDLGYTNVGAYDTTQASYTPNLDTLAAGGLRFTSGYSGDSVCTPSRYGLLTGRYCWRTRLKTFVTGGYSRPLIEDDRLTMPEMFQTLGYETAMVGKWHIGMQFYDPQGNPVDLGNNADVLGTDTASTTDDAIDFSKPLTQTPTAYGFNYFFGSSASLDMPPYTWIENQTVLSKGGIVSGGAVDFSQALPATNSDFLEGEPIGAVNNVRDGVYDPDFIVSDYLQVQAKKVADLLKTRSRDGKPFFIYVPMPAPHLPWAVQSQFSGSTPFAYGDYLAQSDHYAGLILDALDDPDGNPATADSLASNTVVFMSSDNGVEKGAMGQGLNHGHDGNGPFRGNKLDNWEGGTRVPFVIRWPGVTQAGAVTSHSCWQGDFFATMAEFLRFDLNPAQAPDAESFLPVLSGNPMPAERRPATTQHAVNGQIAIVDKDGVWKLLDGTGGNGSNSFDSSNNPLTAQEAAGTIFGTPRQLFNLSTDVGEDNNLLPSTDPAILAKEQELYDLLNDIRGNTTYGTDGDSNVPPIDSDDDGLPNYFENDTSGLDRDIPEDAQLDFDTDGLVNVLEFLNGADLFDPDTDDDKVGDALEVLTYHSLPNNIHSDGDGLDDGDEVLVWNTNPILDDTDGDGFNDNIELANFSNPRNAGSTLVTGAPVTVALAPSEIQLVGSTGTVNDPMVLGGWTESGSLYARERSSGGSNQQLRTRLFLKFDLSSIEGAVTGARLRVFQTHRLNDANSAPLGLGLVTSGWGTTAGSYPLFDGTPVSDTFTFGNNNDFGTATAASGFYGGTPGTIGDETGFDPDGRITNMVTSWRSGTTPNHGIRIAFDTQDLVGAAFAATDNGSTAEDESLKLLVTYIPIENKDGDRDGISNAYETTAFGDLTQSGSDDFDGDGTSNLEEWALGGNAAQSGNFPRYGVVRLESPELGFEFHRIIDAGLGFEVELSEDMDEWVPFTRYYRYQDPAPASELGNDYEKVLLEPVAPLPGKLFHRINIRAAN